MNLKGQKFGDWVVIERGAGRYWLCRCNKCGETKRARQDHLRAGLSKSCGCATHNKTHGQSLTRIYGLWLNMKQRCLNPKNVRYKDYGGIGVTVCERWLAFENFLTDMGERPKGKTLDRVNPFGNYEPSNCRWATATEQARNRRCNRIIEYRGERLCLSEWEERLGFGRNLLSYRLSKGWPINDELFKQPGGWRPSRKGSRNGRNTRHSALQV